MRATAKTVVWVVVAPIIVVVVGIGGCEARKVYYDRQVDGLCKKDGGLTVFERVVLSEGEYAQLGGQMGAVQVRDKPSASASDPFFTETTTTYIKQNNPEIRRDERVFRRRADDKVIARLVYYARVGGDFPSWAHPSSKGCAAIEGDISRKVFLTNGEKK